jgi:hypothetical protein
MLSLAARTTMESPERAIQIPDWQRPMIVKELPDSTSIAVVTWQMDVDNVIAFKSGRRLETALSLFAKQITQLQYPNKQIPAARSFDAIFAAKMTNSMTAICARVSLSGTSL